MRTSTDTTHVDLEATGTGCRVSWGGGALRAILQATRGASARVALVPDRALLLADDHVRLTVRVGAGTHLHLVETSGTVAYDMRGGSARWEVSIEVGLDASVAYETLPWISAAGSDVRRRSDLLLAPGAAAAVRETLVLGRHGEPPGRLLSSTRVVRSGREELVEELDSRDLAPHRVLDAVLTFPACAETGQPLPLPLPVPAPTRLETESGAVLWRHLANEAHVAAAALDRVWARSVAGSSSPLASSTSPRTAPAGDQLVDATARQRTGDASSLDVPPGQSTYRRGETRLDHGAPAAQPGPPA